MEEKVELKIDGVESSMVEVEQNQQIQPEATSGQVEPISNDTIVERQDGVKYQATEGEQHTKENIEEQEGYYDEDGFYILQNGAFYDVNGYYFDQEGYDQYGGYYDGAYYIPGPGYEKVYYKKYQSIQGAIEEEDEEYFSEERQQIYEDKEEEEEEYNIEDYFTESEGDENEKEESKYKAKAKAEAEAKVEAEKRANETKEQQDKRQEEEYEKYNLEQKRYYDEQQLEIDAQRLITISTHINPAIKFLHEQPVEKKLQVRIENVPIKIKKIHIEKLIVKLLKHAGVSPIPQVKQEGDLEKQTDSKIVIEQDIKGNPNGRCWFQSANRDFIIALIKFHSKVWFNHCVKTYLMGGFTYDQDLHADDDFDQGFNQKVEKWVMKNPDYEKEVYKKRPRKQKGGNAYQSEKQYKPKYVPQAMEEHKKSEKIPAATVHQNPAQGQAKYKIKGKIIDGEDNETSSKVQAQEATKPKTKGKIIEDDGQ